MSEIWCSEEIAVKTALGFNFDKDESKIIQFRLAELVITELNKALEIGTDATATAFVTEMCATEF